CRAQAAPQGQEEHRQRAGVHQEHLQQHHRVDHRSDRCRDLLGLRGPGRLQGLAQVHPVRRADGRRGRRAPGSGARLEEGRRLREGPGLGPRDRDPFVDRDRPRGRLDPGHHPPAAQRHPSGQAPPRLTVLGRRGAPGVPRDGRPRCRRPVPEPGPTWIHPPLRPTAPFGASYGGRSQKGTTVLIAQRPTLTEEVVSENRSRFVIEPLEPGFGYTLGNSLRRTLLSSIPGAAVTSIRVDGVLHELSTVPGVTQDITDIILNIKDLVVSSENDEPVVMYLRKEEAGRVTAAEITPPAGVEIHNPDLHIATPNEKGRLEIELVVERGRGYVSAAQNKGFDAEIGRVPVDSIYSPVLKVTYKVEATRVEQRTDFDKLIVDVETKPAISPRDAIASAGKTLVELFGLARELN